ncbi:hypothetical protein EBH_0079040 [Eimeria brunetti]|uniref:Secreted protein n=1 Tax=Eimeria brunetti TaxID=51314 RepID=U6LEB7_9EIME|nr:hypothetical protein EBH_0079040 [Eimeria brunetti]
MFNVLKDLVFWLEVIVWTSCGEVDREGESTRKDHRKGSVWLFGKRTGTSETAGAHCPPLLVSSISSLTGKHRRLLPAIEDVRVWRGETMDTAGAHWRLMYVLY